MCAACEILAGFSFRRCVVLLKEELSSYTKSVVNERAVQKRRARGETGPSPYRSLVRVARQSAFFGYPSRRETSKGGALRDGTAKISTTEKGMQCTGK